MKIIFPLVFLLLIQLICRGQKIDGKWYGKIIQGPGELCEVCNFELNLTHNKSIGGESYTFIKDTSDIRIGLRGRIVGDSIRIEEDSRLVYRSIVPPNWSICIKTLTLKYHQYNNEEFLIGRGTGVSLKDDDPCIPAKIILSKNISALNWYMKDTALQKFFSIEPVIPVPEFTAEFLNTTIKKTTEIEIKNRNIQLQISDYLNVDNDTISVYLNRAVVLDKIKIVKRAIRVDVTLNSTIELNELILFAENLGNIPPNTSQLLIIDGPKTHKLVIESDKQKTAAVYLRYKP